MNRKLLVKYILMYIPMLVGIVLFSYGIINIVSSLLLFLGGYIAIKNTFDYRKVRKNIERVKIDNNDIKKDYSRTIDPEKMVGVKRTRRYSRVRKRIKY